MALTKTLFGRVDNSNAANDTLNVKPGSTTELTFTSDTDGDGAQDGDLVIDADGVGGTDTNTLVSIDGGAAQSFSFIVSGDFPGGGNTPANIVGEQVVLIELADGSRYFFFTDPALQTEAVANSVPNGAAVLANQSADPPGAICFTSGTRIDTPDGARLVDDLRAGDMVVTLDHGPQPIRWIGRRRMTARGRLAPVRVPAGMLGDHDALMVSPQHRLLVSGARAVMMFNAYEVLVKAAHLVARGAVQVEGGEVTYHHLMFDRHEIVFANGLPAESLYPGPQALALLDADERHELFTLFPGLRTAASTPAARPALKAHEAAALLQSVI